MVEGEKRERCVLCNDLYYPSEEMGLLDCYIHPLGMDKRKHIQSRYACCNASNNPRELKDYEIKKVKGCTRIDHVFSFEELKSVLDRPYAFTFSDLRGQEVTILSVTSKEEFANIRGLLQIPKICDSPLFIDVVSEYRDYISSRRQSDAMASIFGGGGYGDDSTESAFMVHSRRGQIDDGSVVFNPFHIIRRVDCKFISNII